MYSCVKVFCYPFDKLRECDQKRRQHGSELYVVCIIFLNIELQVMQFLRTDENRSKGTHEFFPATVPMSFSRSSSAKKLTTDQHYVYFNVTTESRPPILINIQRKKGVITVSEYYRDHELHENLQLWQNHHMSQQYTTGDLRMRRSMVAEPHLGTRLQTRNLGKTGVVIASGRLEVVSGNGNLCLKNEKKRVYPFLDIPGMRGKTQFVKNGYLKYTLL